MPTRCKAIALSAGVALAGASGGIALVIALMRIAPGRWSFLLWVPGEGLARLLLPLLPLLPLRAVMGWLAPEGGPAAYIVLTGLSFLLFWGGLFGALRVCVYQRRQRKP